MDHRLLAFTFGCITTFHFGHGLEITLQPSNQVGAVGKPLWWHCSATGEGILSYRWRHNDAYITVDSSLRILANGTLYMAEVTDQSKGQYQCVVSDGQDTVYSQQAILTLAYIADSFTTSPGRQTKNVGDTVVMQCEIVSVPPAVFMWLLDLKPVTKGAVAAVTSFVSQYTIENVDFHSMGEYVCKAVNPLSGVERYSNTGVLLLEGKPSFVIAPSPQSVPEGMTARFDCQGIAWPTPTTKWMDSRDSNNGKEIQSGGRYTVHSNGSLHIALVTSGDQGYYTCAVNNSWGQTSKTVLLTVTGPVSGPQFTTTAVDTTVFETGAVMFQCSAMGEPAPLISWWKENGDLPPTRTEYPFPGAIKLTNVQVSDAGTYTCRASNIVGSVTHRVKLTVQVGPSFIVTPRDITTTENSVVEIHCQADGTPRPVMTWKLPDSTVLTVPSGVVAGIYVRSNGTLVISDTVATHHGRYTCIATNVVSTATVSATITIQLPPSFTLEPVSHSVLEGDRIVLNCEATGRPLPIILWYKVGNSLPIQTGSSYQLLSNGSLVLPFVRKMHEGQYTCEARNLLTVIHATVKVTVSVPPSFQLLPRDQMVTLGSVVQIECMATGHPTPSVSWRRNGQRIVLEDNMDIYSNNTIHITGLRSSQLGSYTCVAENSVGKREVTADLYTFDQPVWLIAPTNSTGNLSESLTLKCSAKARNPPLFYWYMSDSSGSQGVEIITNQGSNVIVMSTGDLIFQRLRQSDEGWYLCRAVNSVSSVSGHAYLNVQVPPVISTITSPVTVLVGDATSLSCTTSGDPIPSVSWTTPGGSAVTSGDYVVNGNSVRIPRAVVRTHWGVWTCTACNIMGCVNSTAMVYVEGVPALVTVSAIRLKDFLLIHCLAQGTPSPKIRYYIGPTEIQDGLPPPIGHSVLANGTLRAQETDISSNYRCMASNVYGGDTQTLTVPAAPTSLSFTNVQASRVTLAWSNPRIVPPITSHVVQYKMAATGVWTSVDNVRYSIHTLDNLQPFTEYTFRVKAVNAIGDGGYSNATTIRTKEGAPSVPVNVLTTVNGNSIEVTWDAPLEMNGDPAFIIYEVYYSKVNSSVSPIVVQPSATTAVVLHKLDYSSLYDVQLRAGNSQAGTWSDFVKMVVEVYERKPQSAPSGVRVNPRGHDKILVQWNLVYNESVVGYLVAHAPLNTSQYTVERVSGNSHLVTGLIQNTAYLVMVASYNRGGNGSFSTPVSVQTPAMPKPVEPERAVALSDGAIGGIAAGCAGFILLVILIIIICVQQRRLHKMDSLSLAADDEFSKHSMRQNFYSNEINTATVNSAKSGIRGFYDFEGRNNDAYEGELSTDTAYTLGPNNTALPLRIRPFHDSDVVFREPSNPDVVLVSSTPRQEDPPNDTTPELQALQDLDFELDEITSPEDYLEPSAISPVKANSPARSINSHIYNNDSVVESTPRSGPHEYAEVRDGQVRSTSRSTNNTSDESSIYAHIDVNKKANRRNKNQFDKVLKKGAQDFNNINSRPSVYQVDNPMYLPEDDQHNTMQSNLSRDSIDTSLPENSSSLANIMDASLYDTPIRSDPVVRSNSIGRGQPVHMEDSTDDDYDWENDSETEQKNALSY